MIAGFTKDGKTNSIRLPVASKEICKNFLLDKYESY